MKIGAVCQRTGLTDRTVRFYTDEGLLSPSYTKNYLGRKTFDFSEEDVAMLKDIAVLRKYGFSIPEIKSILEDPAKSVAIIDTLRQKKQDTIRSEQELLDALLALESGRAYTVPELAQALDNPILEETELPEEPDDGCLVASCKTLFWLMCGPAALFAIFATPLNIWDWTDTFLYVKLHPWFDEWLLRELGRLVPLLAAFAMYMLEMKCMQIPGAIRQFIAIMLFFGYLFIGNMCFLGSLFNEEMGFYSETEDPADYMILGTYERDEMGKNLDILFPDQIPEYALGENGMPCPETTRYYNYVDYQWDWKFELFAQWQLTEQDLAAEKKRIREELGDMITAQGQLGEWEYWSMRMDPAPCLDNVSYYEKIYADYGYLFFAYHEETGMVRYISCASDDQRIVPGFCTLDWK